MFPYITTPVGARQHLLTGLDHYFVLIHEDGVDVQGLKGFDGNVLWVVLAQGVYALLPQPEALIGQADQGGEPRLPRLKLGASADNVRVVGRELPRGFLEELDRRSIRTTHLEKLPQRTDKAGEAARVLFAGPVRPGNADVVKVGLNFQERRPLPVVVQLCLARFHEIRKVFRVSLVAGWFLLFGKGQLLLGVL